LTPAAEAVSSVRDRHLEGDYGEGQREVGGDGQDRRASAQALEAGVADALGRERRHTEADGEVECGRLAERSDRAELDGDDRRNRCEEDRDLTVCDAQELGPREAPATLQALAESVRVDVREP
jgi:hypothetical protein